MALELPADVPQFDYNTIADVVLHLRYTAREAGHLRHAAASSTSRARCCQTPRDWYELFTLNDDFGDAWAAFGAAADDATRRLRLTVRAEQFPYWVSRVGVGPDLVATFSTIDPAKGRLTLAPATATLAGSPADGWLLDLGDDHDAFAFLKKHRAETVHLSVSYTAG